MDRKLFGFIILVLLIVFMLSLPSVSFGDAGNFAGDSDFGDDGDFGGDSDWGSDSDFGSIFGSSFLFLGGGGVPFIVIILLIAAMSVIRSKARRGTASVRMNTPSSGFSGLPLQVLRQKDPHFNEQAFLEKIGNDYMQLQNAWQSKDWEPMRALMTDALFNQMGRQLEELRQRNLTNHIERIAVLGANIARYVQEGEYDVLFVRLDTRICDYTTDDNTGALVQGDKNRELFMSYEWKMVRHQSFSTLPAGELTKVNCPNCGAPMAVNHSGKCDYCGSVVTLSGHDWALSQISGISQRTA